MYDRYHIQAPYGKEVLGAACLDEARKHKVMAKELYEQGCVEEDKGTRLARKAQVKYEKAQYSTLKQLRWTLLMNRYKLSDNRTEQLNAILNEHAELAVCYAMKEEMTFLFSLFNPVEVLSG